MCVRAWAQHSACVYVCWCTGWECSLGGAKGRCASSGKSLALCQELIKHQMCQATTGGNNPTKLHSCETLHCSGFVLSYLTGAISSARVFFLISTILTKPPLSPHRLLHLAIIHEAKDHALQMIKLSHNHPFLNVQNHQRQVTDWLSFKYLSRQSHAAFKERMITNLSFSPRLPSTSQWSQSSLIWSKGSWKPVLTHG